MSGVSSSGICPICEKEMSIYSDWKPFESVCGECLNCGFVYYTKVEQMDLEEINEKREEYNADMELKGKKRLKPLTQKHLDKFKKSIKEI